MLPGHLRVLWVPRLGPIYLSSGLWASLSPVSRKRALWLYVWAARPPGRLSQRVQELYPPPLSSSQLQRWVACLLSRVFPAQLGSVLPGTTSPRLLCPGFFFFFWWVWPMGGPGRREERKKPRHSPSASGSISAVATLLHASSFHWMLLPSRSWVLLDRRGSAPSFHQ